MEVVAKRGFKTCPKCGIQYKIADFRGLGAGVSKYCIHCRKLKLEFLSDEKITRHIRRRLYVKEYCSTDDYKARRNENLRNRRKNDPLFMLKRRMRNRLWGVFNRMGYGKSKTTEEIIGCSFEYLKSHIEGLFLPGMRWDNYSDWHIDHKLPLATAKTELDIIRLNHYSNLQPLWKLQNLKKGSKV